MVRRPDGRCGKGSRDGHQDEGKLHPAVDPKQPEANGRELLCSVTTRNRVAIKHDFCPKCKNRSPFSPMSFEVAPAAKEVLKTQNLMLSRLLLSAQRRVLSMSNPLVYSHVFQFFEHFEEVVVMSRGTDRLQCKGVAGLGPSKTD